MKMIKEEIVIRVINPDHWSQGNYPDHRVTNRQFHKMVKQTQIADELFECVWPFCGICA